MKIVKCILCDGDIKIDPNKKYEGDIFYTYEVDKNLFLYEHSIVKNLCTNKRKLEINWRLFHNTYDFLNYYRSKFNYKLFLNYINYFP
jgi:hypothetical protein